MNSTAAIHIMFIRHGMKAGTAKRLKEFRIAIARAARQMKSM